MPRREELRISVVLCTHDRPALLRAAIESVLAQDVGDGAYEVIVVDNARSRSAQTVVESFGPRVRYVHEPVLGLSHARNTGWRSARAPRVALLDDDAKAHSGWLSALLDAFEGRARPACVGGRVIPDWVAPRPAWLTDRMLLSLTVADWSDEGHAVTDLTREWLVGANIAFDRSELERLGGFPTGLGRIGRRLLSGEEIFLQRRLLAEARVCWYEPRAAVDHRIDPTRLTPSWFRRRYLAQGRSDAVIWGLERDAHGERRMERLRREARPLLRSTMELIGKRASDEGQRLEDVCGTMWRLGFVAGLLGGS